MAKVTIVTCDKCGTTHEKSNPVRLTTVVGAGSPRGRIDLCGVCRRAVCEFAGYSPTEADEIVAGHDARAQDD